MKTKTLFLSMSLMFITSFSVIAQDYTHVGTAEYHEDFKSKRYCIKVYVHNVMKSDQTGGVDEAILNQQIDSLNTFFDNGGNSGINFVWDGDIKEIYDDDAYNFSFTDCNVSFNVFNNYAHSDGIDLYFFNHSLGASIADGIASNSQIAITNSHIGTYRVAHEVGHVLGLFHPWHSTNLFDYCPSTDGLSRANHIPECVNGGMARDTSGDYVIDTEADSVHPQAWGQCILSDEINPGTGDSCGDTPWNLPDVTNIMSYFLDECNPKKFTPYQITRMKYFLVDPLGNVPDTIEDIIRENCSLPFCNSKTCNMVADFTTTINECTVYFNGENTGTYCPNQTYEWRIDGNLVSTVEDFSHEFTENGTYSISFTIINPDGNTDCYNTINKIVNINNCSIAPPPSPTCPTNECLYIYDNVEISCIDTAVSLGCANDVATVNWTYSLGGFRNVPFGSSTNPFGSYSIFQPLYLPPGNWDNYYLWITANITLTDGTTCVVKQKTLLDCSLGGGFGDPILRVYPNPIKSNQELKFDGIENKDINSIEVFDLFGNSKIKMKPYTNTFNIKNLRTGIYIIRFETNRGIVQKKIVVE